MNQGKPRFFLGLGQGSPGEFTALAVLAQIRPDGLGAACQYALRHLERFAPGTPSGEIVDHARDLLRTPMPKRSVLVVDQTGRSCRC